MPARAQDIKARAEALKAERAPLDSHLQELRDNFNPSGDAIITREVLGVKTHQRIYNSAPEQALDSAAAGLYGMLVNPSIQWFGYRDHDEGFNRDREAGAWLDAAALRSKRAFDAPSGNFAPQQHEKYKNVLTYGTAAMFLAEIPGRPTRFQTHPMAGIYVAENDEGRVDTVYNCYRLTARQAVQKFGDRAPAKVREAAGDDNRKDEKFEFVHATYPRRDRDRDRLDNGNMPFASVHLCLEGDELIAESGYPEFPWVVPRWEKRAGEAYGRSPAMKTLPDAKMLQRVMAAVISGAELAILPPVQVPDDGVIGPVRLTPKGVNTVRGDLLTYQGGGIRPVLTGAQPQLGMELVERIVGSIERAFFADLIRFPRDPRMTATQFLELVERIRQDLGPIIGRLETEDLGPMIERNFQILVRQGFIPPPPPQMAGRAIRVEYFSPVQRAMRMSQARAVAQTMELVGPLGQLHPEVWDQFDLDATALHIADLFGWPKDTLRAPEAVAEIRRARNEASEERTQTQDLMQGGEVAAHLLPALANAAGGGGQEAA